MTHDVTICDLSPSQKKVLLQLARHRIEQTFLDSPADGRSVLPASEDALLAAPAACFVTLTLGGALRGCIGSLEAHRSLLDDVCANAYAAAFRDPRFPPLQKEELDRLHIEISVLTPLEEMVFISEDDLLQQVVPFEDGLVLEDRGHRGTFLPLVWKQLPDKKDFFSHLKQKAGLPSHHWSDTLRCFRYHTLVFEE